MSRKRDAIDTITGYYYQFDYYIIQLLNLISDDDTVMIEGIEDVDVSIDDETVAIQCKYYSKTEYNHSIIAKPIRFMIMDYIKRIPENRNIRYKLYGNYKSGQNKFPGVITLDFAKNTLFTYTEKQVKHILHEEFDISDETIEKFLNMLDVDVNAIGYTEQEEKLISKLEDTFDCGRFEAEFYYYNNALRFVKRIATLQDCKDRIVTKREFLDAINCKEMLFDAWYLQFKGEKEYSKAIKKQYFTNGNVSPYKRFFLIECDKVIDDKKLRSLILKISKNWSKLSRRETKPFCPYIFLYGISKERLIDLKNLIQEFDVIFSDGYDFLGADFLPKSINREPNFFNKVEIKIINELDFIDRIICDLSGVIEIYQFYLDKPFYDENDKLLYRIQIPSTESINMMI